MLKPRLKAMAGAFAVIVGGDFLVHHGWLGGFYKAHPDWWAAEAQMQERLPLLLLGQLVLAALLTLVYAKGYEPHKGKGNQGMRFGLLMGLVLTVPQNLLNAVIYPYPTSLLISWVVGGLFIYTLAGTVIGALYRPAP